jgi:hypothetical protein
LVIPNLQIHSRGKILRRPADVVADEFDQPQRVLFAGAKDIDQHRRPAVEPREQIHVLETVDDPGDLAQGDRGAVGCSNDGLTLQRLKSEVVLWGAVCAIVM